MHGLLVLALSYAAIGRPIPTPPVRAIQIEIITADRYQAANKARPLLPEQLLGQPARNAPETEGNLADSPADGMTTATNFFARKIIEAPENREVRTTLPTLERSERIIQLCNIEGLEQLRLARPGTLPDSLVAAAFAQTIVTDHTLVAPAGAYRSARKWFAVHYSCAVTPDFESVTAFRFEIGAAIPESEWEDHFLLAEDEDE